MWFESKKPIIALAPMADYTDLPFCRICREVSGDDFVIFREMVSSEAIIRDNEKTLKMCEFDKDQRPVILQIFGSDLETMSKAVKIINDKFKPDGIDINMGCPVPKITNKNQAGSALIKDPDKAVKIIKKIRKDNPGVVLSVKTRLGWNDKNDILGFAPRLEKAGVQLLTIHGRTKKQGYSGQADWEMIGKVKKLVNIPVIANGDIKNKEDIKNCLEITKADGVMIGRAALGNPWIFGKNKKSIEVVLRHAKYHLDHYGENSMTSFRKHLLWYFKSDRLGRNIKEIKKLRQKLVAIDSYEDLKYLLDNLVI
jgi:tRNA-dihydrouridine synthase B